MSWKGNRDETNIGSTTLVNTLEADPEVPRRLRQYNQKPEELL